VCQPSILILRTGTQIRASWAYAARVNVTQWILIGMGFLAAALGLLAFAGRGPKTRGLDEVGRIYRGTSALLLSAYAFTGGLSLDSGHEVWIWIGLALLFTALGLSMAARQRVIPIPLDEPSSGPTPDS
jgi:hypothetical protein